MGKRIKIGMDMKIQWIDRWVRADNRPNPEVYMAKRELSTKIHFAVVCKTPVIL
jgi:hypothetical protein